MKGYEVDVEIGARCAFLAANKKAAQSRIRRHMRRFLSKRPIYAYRIRIKKIRGQTAKVKAFLVTQRDQSCDRLSFVRALPAPRAIAFSLPSTLQATSALEF